MSSRWWLSYLTGLLIAAGLSWFIYSTVSSRAARSEPRMDQTFFAQVDLSPLETMSVWSEGRLKSFGTFAREVTSAISGPNRIAGLRPEAAYLDLMLRPSAYEGAPIIYVKNKLMRAPIADVLVSSGAADEVWAQGFIDGGLAPREFFLRPEVGALMRNWQRDVVRTAKFVDRVHLSLMLSEPQELLRLAAVIPPSGRDPNQPWRGLDAIWSTGPSFVVNEGRIDDLDGQQGESLRASFASFARAWIDRNAEDASEAAAAFASALAQIAPELYPTPRRMSLESLYFGAGHLTWVWLIYLLSAILLLMATIYRWSGARAAGLGVFSVAFALHTGALIWRWYISGRWPNSNMFEAVTTSVWLGTALAIGVEITARKSALRNLFALCGAGASMVGLMAAHFATQLDPNINNMAPILHDIWLYIHTNVIIASYAVIAMAAISAIFYLVRRILGGTPDYASAGGAATLISHRSTSDPSEKPSLGEILDGATMVLMELAFVMLWTGIVMGAVWADHSWGRPWGWDPKEVFALNTFLVFLILVHVRLKVRDKGLWTALLAVAGAGVMIFNWYVINFIIAGLHSYA